MTINRMVEVLIRSYDYKCPVSEVMTFVTNMIRADKVIYSTEGFAFYVKTSDELIKEIESNPGFILQPGNLMRVFTTPGENVHFFGVISTNKNKDITQSILRGLKDTIDKEHPKTITWWDRTMNRFIRRNLCRKH